MTTVDTTPEHRSGEALIRAYREAYERKIKAEQELDEIKSRIVEHYNHPQDMKDVNSCQRTYREGLYGIQITTRINYSLNKKVYESMSQFIPQGLDPVIKREKIDYVVDPKVHARLSDYIKTLTKKDDAPVRDVLLSFIELKDAPPTIKIVM